MRFIKVTQALLYLNAAIWLVFSLTTLFRLNNSGNTSVATQLVILILMAGNVVAMLLSGWGIGRKNRLIYIFALIVMLVNILLTFTDQFGFFDLATLLLDLAILTLLVIGWKEIFRSLDKNRQSETS
jgi:lysylphosphatidylglycerol synthetase-like protein (DUF2156 family)